jgi:CVNH domain
MKARFWLFTVVTLAGLSVSAYAQSLPPGSYMQSCWDIRMQGPNLTALCRRADGRGERLTALNVAHCIGDIGNNNGNLVCNGGRPVPPSPRPGAGPGSPPPPGPGYPPPRYGYGDQAYWAHCERLRAEEHELSDRLAYAPYGPERERLQYRLGQVHTEREQCWRNRP